MFQATIATPLGDMLAIASEDCLLRLTFKDVLIRKNYPINTERAHPILKMTKNWLKAYFLRYDIPQAPPLELEGSVFAQSVWAELQTIAAGQTLSYGAIANRLKHPTASRAVGLLVGRNPIDLMIPCHRVIGSSGKLTGYQGGLWRKEWLLKHEGYLK